MTVTITKTLDDNWATPEQFASMCDAQIIAMIQEDISAFLDGACWEVERLPEETVQRGTPKAVRGE